MMRYRERLEEEKQADSGRYGEEQSTNGSIGGIDIPTSQISSQESQEMDETDSPTPETGSQSSQGASKIGPVRTPATNGNRMEQPYTVRSRKKGTRSKNISNKSTLADEWWNEKETNESEKRKPGRPKLTEVPRKEWQKNTLLSYQSPRIQKGTEGINMETSNESEPLEIDLTC